MMMMPAARSKSRLSGILTIELAGSAIFSRAPLWPQEAITRSPTFRSVTPEPTLSITPATSAAGENGNGGLIWYLPWIIRMSKKFSAAALIAMTAWPGSATGSGMSVSTRSSGWQYCEQRMAFMAAPVPWTLKLFCLFLPDLAARDNPVFAPVFAPVLMLAGLMLGGWRRPRGAVIARRLCADPSAGDDDMFFAIAASSKDSNDVQKK